MPNKNYLIVGGSSGIGLALVKKLQEKGHNLTVISRNRGALPESPHIHHIALDIAVDEIDPAGLPDVIDGLAYCPGSINLKPFRSLKPASFLADFQINVLGAVKVLQATHKPMKKASDGAAVVLFSTVAVGQGMPFHASVAASKGAVEGLTRSLAAEWSPSVRVNCIAPSLTDTPLAARLLSSPEKRTASAQRHPLKRVGSANDIAGLASFLLTEQGSWMTGQVIGMDGGMSSLKV